MKRVLGVLSGNDMPLAQIEAWARSAEVVLAADGGANALEQLGIRADAAIGDFDSITTAARQRPLETVYDPDQDRSDCDKLLAFAAGRGYEAITLCNIEGDRLDHVLATLHSAARSSLTVRLALRRGLGLVLKGECEATFTAVPGETLSLLPLETCEQVSLTGVAWPLSNQQLSPQVKTSLSNQVSAERVSVKIESGSAVLFLTTNGPAEPAW